MDNKELHEIRMKVGDCLRSHRRGKGLTVKGAAEITGYTPNTIQRLEEGHIDLGYSKLLAYCRSLGMDAHISTKEYGKFWQLS